MKADTQLRNPARKGKNQPKMLGGASMSCASESSKFKSAFGNLAPTTISKRLQPKAHQNFYAVPRRQNKPISFFDSQKLNKEEFYQNNLVEQEGIVLVNSGANDQMVDINNNQVQMIGQAQGID